MDLVKKHIDLGLDATDALILRYFIDFKDRGGMHKEIFEGEFYYCFKYKNLIEELQILGRKTKDSV